MIPLRSDNGLLIIRPEFEAGFIDHEYYFIDSTGQRVKAKKHYDPEDRSKGVTLGSSGSMGGAMRDGSVSSESPSAIRYTNLYVYDGSKAYNAREHTLRAQRMDSLTVASVGNAGR